MRRLLPLLALVPAALAAPAAVPPDPLDSLVKDSPFLPAAGAPRAAPAGEGGPLELRSVVFERGQFAFSIYDSASRESKWVTLGPGDAPFTARSYDREHDVLTVDYQGRSLALKLQPAHTAGQAPAGTVPSPPPLPTAGPPAGQNPPPNAAPATPGGAPALSPAEAQRLQNMADEIRRRRQQPVPAPQK